MQVKPAGFFMVLTIVATIPACSRYDVIPTVSIKDLTTWEVSEARRWWASTHPYHGGGYLYGARPYGFYYW